MKQWLLTVFYDLFLFIFALICFPKFLWDILVLKKYRKSFLSRVRGKGPNSPPNSPLIWLHAVSVGESKALATLVPHIRKSYPMAFILVSTVTETGQQEVKKRAPLADAFCYLPFDFSWIIRRFVRGIRPDLLILVEGDFWYHLLKEVNQVGGAIILVNGKISKSSFKRFLFFKPFSQRLFQKINYFCVQDENYFNRFLKLGIDPNKMSVIDNLKYDIPLPEISEENRRILKETLGIREEDNVITIGSTHEGEEELLLKTLKPLWNQFQNIKILLVPRHPERFRKIEKLMKKTHISYVTYSMLSHHIGNEKVILIDKMGLLPMCYRISDLSIVGGSFVKGVGGHDIFEPAKMGLPVFFGPYMEKQASLLKTLLQSGVGKQVSIDDLAPTLEKYLIMPSLMNEEGKKGKDLAEKMMGSAFRTWKQIKPYTDDKLRSTNPF